jgi:hypothetical protein
MAENEGERRWVVEPPEPGEVALHIAIGEGVKLTPEQEAAVGELLRSLEAVDSEVTGHALAGKCTKQSTCTKLTCDPVSCNLKCGTLSATLTAGGGTSWSLMGSFNTGLQ